MVVIHLVVYLFEKFGVSRCVVETLTLTSNVSKYKRQNRPGILYYFCVVQAFLAFPSEKKSSGTVAGKKANASGGNTRMTQERSWCAKVKE